MASSASGGADPTSSLLPSYSDAYANWSVAGLAKVGGIPTGRADCTTAQAGVTMPLAPSGGDDQGSIQTAISNCPANTVVELGAGTFQIASTSNHNLFIGKSITIRGAGTCNNASVPYCQTVINVTNGASAATYNNGSSNCSGTCNQNSIFYIAPQNQLNLNNPQRWGSCSWGSNASSCGVALDADAAQGQTTVQVHATTGLSAGMFVRIDEASAAITFTGPLGSSVFADPNLTSASGSPATGRIAYGGASVEDGQAYGALYDRETSEIHQIASIGAGPCPGANCTLTFDSPLTIAFRQSGGHGAEVFAPNNPFVQKAGVENMTLKGATHSPIFMEFCAYCWVKNVETDYWVSGVIISNSMRVEITGSYFHDCADCENNGAEYPLALDGATTETLVDNNIIRLGGKGMVGRACGGGNVVAYNYVDDTFYQAASIGNYWLDMAVNGSHYTGCHHVLFEGNWGDNCDNDNTHGNIMYHTYFRNWCTGLRTNFNDPSFALSTSSTYNPSDEAVSDASNSGYQAGGSPAYPHATGQKHAAGAMAENYWHAFVGNVLGEPGVTTSGAGWTYQHNGQQDKVIWMLGWVGGGNNDPNLTGAAGSYLFRHGNWDSYDAAISDWQASGCGAGACSHTLPDSFYVSGAPSFFSTVATCAYSWPWVTPTGGSQIQTPGGGGSCSSYSGLPAKARWDAGTPFVQP
ncbi:MAG: hypothetical protein JO288_05565 [Hyphomicrobiales bacterium]|nr:hypothetical protein [Hyphomicrobiales bacterium]